MRAELAAGAVVRNRPSRGTLQVTAPEDLHWMSATLSPRSRRASEQRRGQLGLDEGILAAAEAVVLAELADGAVRSRPALVAACAERGVELDGQQAGHVLRHLTEMMTIVFAGPEGRADMFARADGWIGERRDVRRAEALAEVALRFVRARGPVTRADLGRWADLSMGDVDAGLDAAADDLETVTLDGADYLVARGTADIAEDEVDAALGAPLLLPAFDEYLLGYGTRGPIISATGLELVCPGRNGVFRPMVVVDGEIVGTWRRTVNRAGVTVTVEPFGTLTVRSRKALAAPARAFGEFLGKDAVVAP
ncbi:winged helix DNA-binding domain-containing protein [Tsukamurella soli]|uniref:Winged helix DNA-binding domain-containing protein n=1 Tax=Tsukamurella soli TaxID=644556 RepID=A0ABP8KE94_9ACTN